MDFKTFSLTQSCSVSGANTAGLEQAGLSQRVLLELPWQSWAGRRPGCRDHCQLLAEARLPRGCRINLNPPEASCTGDATRDCVPSHKVKGTLLNATHCQATCLKDGDRVSRRKCRIRKTRNGINSSESR